MEAYSLLQVISNTEDPAELVKTAILRLEGLTGKPLVIGKELLEDVAREIFRESKEIAFDPFPNSREEAQTSSKAKRKFSPQAKDVEKDVSVIEDPTSDICSTGSID